MFDWVPPSHCIGSICWERASGGHVPPGAVHGGKDLDGGEIYVGRASHGGDVLPAKVCPSHGCAFVCFAGEEIPKQEYEVLISSHVAWKEAEGGSVPPEAIQVGRTNTGEALYCGRTLLNGTLTVGKVHPSHGVLYIPWNGEEQKFSRYEVLVLC